MHYLTKIFSVIPIILNIWITQINHSNGGLHFSNYELPPPRNCQLLAFNAAAVLWPFFVETDLKLPVRKLKTGVIIDSHENEYRPYKNVTNVLKNLKDNGVKLAGFCNTLYADEVEKIFEYFGWKEIFDIIKVYQSRIDGILETIYLTAGIKPRNMILFDNNEKNYRTVQKMRIYQVTVQNGITYDVVRNAYLRYYKEPKYQNVTIPI